VAVVLSWPLYKIEDVSILSVIYCKNRKKEEKEKVYEIKACNHFTYNTLYLLYTPLCRGKQIYA
jgi:hypothetical protein